MQIVNVEWDILREISGVVFEIWTKMSWLLLCTLKWEGVDLIDLLILMRATRYQYSATLIIIILLLFYLMVRWTVINLSISDTIFLLFILALSHLLVWLILEIKSFEGEVGSG